MRFVRAALRSMPGIEKTSRFSNMVKNTYACCARRSNDAPRLASAACAACRRSGFQRTHHRKFRGCNSGRPLLFITASLIIWLLERNLGPVERSAGKECDAQPDKHRQEHEGQQ
jgi:hypothetical protein